MLASVIYSSCFGAVDMTKEYHGKRKRSDDEKRSRKRRRAKKKGFIDAAVEREGCTYGAGQFGV